MNDLVLVSRENGVADVRINRPEKHNALNHALIEALVAVGEDLGKDASVRCVVLSGEGKSFCSGLDFMSYAAAGSLGDIESRTHGDSNIWQHVALVWRHLPVPVIGAVHGVAFGGGFQIALGADMRFVAPDTQMSVMEIKLGLVPDMGGVVLMRTLARDDVIRDLTYTGRIFTAEEALQYGFATRIVEEPHAAAMAYATKIAAEKNPHAIRAAKRLFNQTNFLHAKDILMSETREQVGLLGTRNQMEAVSANLAKRPPVFVDP